MDQLTLPKLKEMVFDLRNFNMGELSHKLCLIRRASAAIKPGFNVTPITDYVSSRLAICLRNHDIRQLVEAFERLHGLSSARGMSGVIFENICHQVFRRRIRIECVQMARLRKNQKKNEPSWHSSHESNQNHISGNSGQPGPKVSGNQACKGRKLEKLH